jgi:hypothetical protein
MLNEMILSTSSVVASRSSPSFLHDMAGWGVPVVEQRMKNGSPNWGLLVAVKLVMLGEATDRALYYNEIIMNFLM